MEEGIPRTLLFSEYDQGWVLAFLLALLLSSSFPLTATEKSWVKARAEAEQQQQKLLPNFSSRHQFLTLFVESLEGKILRRTWHVKTAGDDLQQEMTPYFKIMLQTQQATTSKKTEECDFQFGTIL